MPSETKAAQIWGLIHSNPKFISTMLRAITKNQPGRLQDALSLLNRPLKDLVLNEVEMDHFSRGFTPEGSLEIISWQGYYVAEPLPSGDNHALLITTITGSLSVHWGPEKDLLNNYKAYTVQQECPSDGSLRFTTPFGDVSLKLSREYDVKEYSIGPNKFKGTIGENPVEGSFVIPSRPDASKLEESASNAFIVNFSAFTDTLSNATVSNLGVVAGAQSWWVDLGSTVWQAGSTFVTLSGGPLLPWSYFCMFRDVYAGIKFIHDKLRGNVQATQATLAPVAETVIEMTPWKPEVNWSGSHREIVTEVQKKFNEKLDHADFREPITDAEAEEFHKAARTMLQEVLESYSKRKCMEAFGAKMAPLADFVDLTQLGSERLVNESKLQATEQFRELSNGVIQDLGDQLVQEHQAEYYRRSSTQSRTAYGSAKAAADASAKRLNDAQVEITTKRKELEKLTKEEDPLLQEKRESLKADLKRLERSIESQRKDATRDARELRDHETTMKEHKTKLERSEKAAKDARAKFETGMERHVK